MYIEDLNNHTQGPLPMQLNPAMTVRALKAKVSFFPLLSALEPCSISGSRDSGAASPKDSLSQKF